MGRMLDTGRIWCQSIKIPLVSHKKGWEVQIPTLTSLPEPGGQRSEIWGKLSASADSGQCCGVEAAPGTWGELPEPG